MERDREGDGVLAGGRVREDQRTASREALSPVPVMTRSACVITDTEVFAELLFGAPVGSVSRLRRSPPCALSL